MPDPMPARATDLEAQLKEYRALARENYGLLLLLQDEVGNVSADALRATAESRVVRQETGGD